jgi:hypothetical protein
MLFNNPSIPNEKNEKAVQTAGAFILSTSKNALAGGRLNDVLGYLKKVSRVLLNLYRKQQIIIPGIFKTISVLIRQRRIKLLQN